MRCPYCKTEVEDGVKFCTECGATLNAAAVQREIFLIEKRLWLEYNIKVMCF